jgi:hypothetical protein
VDGLALGDAVVLEQRLGVLPAGEAADLDLAVLGAKVDLDDAVEVGAAAVAKDGALHVGGLDLLAAQDELALGRDNGLGDVDAVAVRLAREAEDDADGVFLGRGLDGGHGLALEINRVVDVPRLQLKVDGPCPGRPGQMFHLGGGSICLSVCLTYQTQAG